MLTGCRNIFRKHMSLSVLIAATSCECIVIINHHTDSNGMHGLYTLKNGMVIQKFSYPLKCVKKMHT